MNEISIRRSEPEDYRAILAIVSQPEAIWGTLQTPYPSANEWRRRLSEDSGRLYALVASLNAQVVGHLGLHLETSPRRRHAATLGMVVHDRWQGRGVGRALIGAAIDLADNWLNLSRLELSVYTDNAAAIALYEKVGFTIEGKLRNYAFRDGRFVDAYCMARFRSS